MIYQAYIIDKMTTLNVIMETWRNPELLHLHMIMTYIQHYNMKQINIHATKTYNSESQQQKCWSWSLWQPLPCAAQYSALDSETLHKILIIHTKSSDSGFITNPAGDQYWHFPSSHIRLHRNGHCTSRHHICNISWSRSWHRLHNPSPSRGRSLHTTRPHNHCRHREHCHTCSISNHWL